MKLRYTLVIEPTDDSEFFGVYVPDLPGCTAIGTSINEAIEVGVEAIEEHVVLLKELGKRVPPETFRPVIKVLTEPGEEPPEWVKMSEAVQYLGLSESTIRRYVKAGKLQAYQHARDFLFELGDLKRFVRKGRVMPEGAA
jgi:excisionase family DNA binding protein